jgi:hypothetical protein
MCGGQDRFCNASGVWEYGACEGEGVCAPGTTRTASCGRCGTRVERCVASCSWDTSGACTGETGACVPGELRTVTTGCPLGQSRTQRCSDTCGFVDDGPCVGTDAGVPDAGPRDGGVRDAGSLDGGGMCQPSNGPCSVNTDCCSGFCFAILCL